MNKHTILSKTFLLVGLLGVSLGAIADEQVICTHGQQIRTILLDYEVDGQLLPCKVYYKKSTGTQVLWTAQGEAGFCESKMEAFVKKQEGWGWRCVKTPILVPKLESPEPQQVPSPSSNDDLLEGIELDSPGS